MRFLHFGSEWVQGAMRIARPYSLELEYTREMMAALLLRAEPEWPRKVLLIGLGAGSLLKFLYRHRPRARFTVVEIDPRVPAMARDRFNLPDDAQRIDIVIDDAARFVESAARCYDLILVDGYDHRARAGNLDNEAFYHGCRARLDDNGLVAFNLFGNSRGYRRSLERINTAFDDRALAFPSSDSGNVVCFAAIGDAIRHPFEELRAGAQALRKATALNLGATLTRLEASGQCPGGVLAI